MTAPIAPWRKWRALALLSVAELLAMSLWFSATAVTPALMALWDIGSGAAAWLTMAVQLGFVAGAVGSAFFNLADVWPPRAVFALGAVAGAGLTAAIPLFHPSFAATVTLRFGTGMTLALVYPVGMKIMATWTREDRGRGIGLLVGALTVGSASPHLVRALGGIHDWERVLYVVSALATVGGLLGWLFGALGPFRATVPPFRWRYMGRALSDRGMRLANLGYLGHMWELYAMWTWIPLFLIHVFGPTDRGATRAAVTAFAVIAVGGVGSIVAGHVADRWGRSRTTILSMVTSGGCALAIGWLTASTLAVTIVALLWGFAVVADSAQFSTSVSELAEPEYMGTMLTMQTAMGFLLTMGSIRLTPVLVDAVGWQWAFSALAVGPALGVWAMWRLLQSPAARSLAGGRG